MYERHHKNKELSTQEKALKKFRIFMQNSPKNVDGFFDFFESSAGNKFDRLCTLKCHISHILCKWYNGMIFYGLELQPEP